MSKMKAMIKTQDDLDMLNGNNTVKTMTKRRTRVPDRPNKSLNLWSVIKNCIGKDLTKIPLPVNFNEPLSMLQRLNEEYEYAELLDKAAMCNDISEQLSYLAAYTISCYSTTADRCNKPFNPLLGETYECDRTSDMGWRCISEQVSHHPPVLAQYCEGNGWRVAQHLQTYSKFRGKHVDVKPIGIATIEFLATGTKYSWTKVTTSVHNLIIGKLLLDNHGEIDIVGDKNANGYCCHLKYSAHSYFSRDAARQVRGLITNPQNAVKIILNGNWDDKIEVATVLSVTRDNNYNTGTTKTIWKRRLPPTDSYLYYNFTIFSCQLNELESGVAPTDSRLRPDQRLMEDGDWDASNRIKLL